MPLIYGLAVVVTFILALTWGAVQVQVTLAGFLNGESLWSKAQKQLVLDLESYASTGNRADLDSFNSHLKIVLADRRARDAIASGSYQRASVENDFLRGGVIGEATSGMVFILDHFSGMPHMRQALQAWYSTDSQLDQLRSIADELQRSYADGQPGAGEIARQRERVQTINRIVSPKTDLFSVEIARGAAWLGRLLFIGVSAASGLAFLIWLWMALRILAGIRVTEDRFQTLFNSAADAIVVTDESTGVILDANATACKWLGRSASQLQSKRLLDLFELENGSPDLSGATGVLHDERGQTRAVEIQSRLTTWDRRQVRQAIIRDISERVAMEQERRVATKALGSIAEGVIIADADRRVLTVNAAHVEITGFSAQSLHGHRFDETRFLLDDNAPLPDSIWHRVEAGGNWRGEVTSRRRDGTVYPELLSISAIRDVAGLVQQYVAVFTNISANKADRRRLEHMATHDPLTGLFNRGEFERRCSAAIERAIIDRSCVAVLFIDLDAFKIVNDSYTHAIGDVLLAKLAERIRGELRDNEYAGRIGGDEFTVFTSGLRSREHAGELAKRLLKALAEPVVIDEHELAVTASIGVAAYPLDGDDTASLIMHADAAMYAAKNEERNAIRYYSPVMQAGARRRLETAADLRQALAREEFVLMFQPSIELRTGRIVAVEALLRWHHPTRGVVMPDNFIPMAESLGLIRRIDEWVMHAACRQIRAWDELQLAPIRVAVNVSASWFGHSSFAANLAATLAETGVSADRLMLEITESAILRLGEGTESTMRTLHDMGVSVAIDDFGTGYSSLAYLKLPAVACLKIDRSFITGLPDSPNDVAIVEAMLAIARSLDIYTIAEGIETDAQHDFLLRSDCKEAQGYLYARPLNCVDLQKVLQSRATIAPVRLHLVPPVRS